MEDDKKKQDYNHPNNFEATTNNHEVEEKKRRPKDGLLGPGRPIFLRRCKKTINLVLKLDKNHDKKLFYIYNRNKN